MPFAVALRDGVMTLTLDTPGSSINIFNHATARQLREILPEVDPTRVRAIVFETAKPSSFVNGVGLLLAHAARTHEDVIRASTLPWEAYLAVRRVPVPTIAVVQGSCFGCGVEFVLNCDYRIATDTCETQFYMTELNDYLFIPVFGSTWNLPATVGLADAIDLLLWGERWNASKARAGGLIDEVIPHEDLEERKHRFVRGVLDAGSAPSRRERRPLPWGEADERALRDARSRIEALPPRIQPVYRDALHLLEAGRRQIGGYVEHQRRELEKSSASALSEGGKAAYSFFYLRQVAAERAAGRSRNGAAPVTLHLDAARGEADRDFIDDLSSRKLAGVSLRDGPPADFRLGGSKRSRSDAPAADPGLEPRDGDAALELRDADGSYRADIAVQLSLGARPTSGLEIYAPAYRGGGRVIELAGRTESGPAADALAALARTLQRFGFEVARTTPSDAFVSQRLLLAYLVPIVRAIEGGAEVAAVNGELRGIGFVRRPHELIAMLDRAELVELLSAALGRPTVEVERVIAALESSRYVDGPEGALGHALCLSLLEAVLSSRAREDVRDTTILDLIARELLDFPLDLRSLSSWLRTERVARALEAEVGLSALVSPSAIAAARAFVVAGRELYR